MKRVVILSGVYPNIKCGVAYHTWVVAQSVAELGSWDVHVLTSDSPEIDRKRERNFELHPRIRRWSPLSLRAIVREIRSLSPDVLHFQNPTVRYVGRANLMPALLPVAGRSLWKDTRLVITQHDLAISHWLMQKKHGLLLRRAHAVTVSNDRDYQAMLRLCPAMEERTYLARVASHFHPPGLSRAEGREVRSKLGVPGDALLLTYFGFVVPGRRLDTLVRAAGILKSKGLPFRLVVMGGAGPGAEAYMASCKALTRTLGLDDEVTWTGYAQARNIENTVAAADVFISPIERGADFRNSSLLVAMEAGVPVLTTENPRYGVDRDLRARGVCRFFDASDPQSLAEAVSDLTGQRDATARMREAMREVAALHTWQEHARVLDMAYRGEPPDPYDPVAQVKHSAP